MTARALAREAERQRQQGRDASQLARRGGAERRRSRAGLSRRRRARHHRSSARRRPAHHLRRRPRYRQRARAGEGARRAQHRRRSRGPICSSWQSRSGPISSRWSRCAPGEITSQAGWDPSTPTGGMRAVVSQASGGGHSRQPLRRPGRGRRPLGGRRGRRSHRAVYRALRPRLSRGPRPGELRSVCADGDAGPRAWVWASMPATISTWTTSRCSAIFLTSTRYRSGTR